MNSFISSALLRTMMVLVFLTSQFSFVEESTANNNAGSGDNTNQMPSDDPNQADMVTGNVDAQNNLFELTENQDVDLEQLALNLDETYGLMHFGSDWQNYLGENEKWLINGRNEWFFIKADGSFYLWEPGKGFKGRTKLAQLNASYYENTGLIYSASSNNFDHLAEYKMQQLNEAKRESEAGFSTDPTIKSDYAIMAHGLNNKYNLQDTGHANDYFDWGGMKEKWVVGGTRTWYFITTDGALYEWLGGNLYEEENRMQIAKLDSSFYVHLEKLYDDNLTKTNYNDALEVLNELSRPKKTLKRLKRSDNVDTDKVEKKPLKDDFQNTKLSRPLKNFSDEIKSLFKKFSISRHIPHLSEIKELALQTLKDAFLAIKSERLNNPEIGEAELLLKNLDQLAIKTNFGPQLAALLWMIFESFRTEQEENYEEYLVTLRTYYEKVYAVLKDMEDVLPDIIHINTFQPPNEDGDELSDEEREWRAKLDKAVHEIFKINPEVSDIRLVQLQRTLRELHHERELAESKHSITLKDSIAGFLMKLRNLHKEAEKEAVHVHMEKDGSAEYLILFNPKT